jgi:hypothetical protein
MANVPVVFHTHIAGIMIRQTFWEDQEIAE